MLTRKTVCLAAALTSMLVMDVVSATAQEWKTCFTLASLKGSYSVVGTYGANIAIAFGKRHVDGDGNLTGTFLVNEPTPRIDNRREDPRHGNKRRYDLRKL